MHYGYLAGNSKMADDDGYDELAYEQRLKAAIHYTVGQICEQLAKDEDVVFTRQFIATLAEATYKQCGILATDLELFAKHAKRSVINSEDVKLAVRRANPLYLHLTSLNEKQAAINEVEKEKKKKKKAKEASSEYRINGNGLKTCVGDL
ncbi:centromere protein S-like [Ptychodera flava]|uniref:centromere protein S-like n=1 Tax=Ptychodera flava TaxID=63121 RepID=UPI00396AA2C8